MCTNIALNIGSDAYARDVDVDVVVWLERMPSAIFYAEFDNVAGPQIRYQAPSKYLSGDTFDSISDYIIIDKPLCGRIITSS